MAFQALMKVGTTVVDALQYTTFLYPNDPEEFKGFLNEKYAETMKAWEEDALRANEGIRL